MSPSLVEYQSENHIATITMNDPKTLNAFSTPLKNAMIDALDQADKDADVRVIVLQGSNNNFSISLYSIICMYTIGYYRMWVKFSKIA